MRLASLAFLGLASLVCVLVILGVQTDDAGPKGAERACHYRAAGALPDARCTPGALNHAVTQRTIGRTICVRGWTATVRPSSSATAPMKLVSMREYGFAFGTSPAGYEYDHLIPLELGGAPRDAANLWPEPHSTSFGKDGAENHLRALVCAGAMRLAEARRIVRTDWRKAP